MNSYIILSKTSEQSLLAKYHSLAEERVICSKRENFSTTCIEAQCCGTPVIGFDTRGTKETSVISSQDFGAYGNLRSLEARLHQRVSENRNNIAEKAQKAYSKETMARRYMEKYDKEGHKEKVLLIDVNCKGSSTGKIVYDLYTSLRANGRQAAICYGRGELVNEENIYKFGLDWETKIHAGLARISGYNGCFSPISTKRLIKFIEDYEPDLIHIHELHAYFVNLRPLLEYIKAKKIPLVWTFHCEYMYTGKCGHAYNCLGYQRECGHCPAVHDYPKSLVFDRTKQMLKEKKKLLGDLDFTIVTPSLWLADRVKLSFLKDKPIEIIHNGVDTNIFHPVEAGVLKQQLGIPYNYKVVLFVAPNIMSEAKGGKWVLKLADAMQDEKIRFVLVGGGGDMAELPNNISYIGNIRDQRLLAQYYSMADIFVLFSKKETYSMTCAEALCCGTPVIGFKCGAPETVFDMPEAKFVEYGDIIAVIKQLREVLYV